MHASLRMRSLLADVCSRIYMHIDCGVWRKNVHFSKIVSEMLTSYPLAPKTFVLACPKANHYHANYTRELERTRAYIGNDDF